MSAAAIAVLERALQHDDIDSIHADIRAALGSLKQQPGVINSLTLHARLEREIAKFDSAAQAAAAWGVSRQVLWAVQNAYRPCPPAILSALGLRKVGAGRTLYREV